jgi:hypothetical protein
MKPEDFWRRFGDLRHRLERTLATSRVVLLKSEAVLARRRRTLQRQESIRAGVKTLVTDGRSARMH